MKRVNKAFLGAVLLAGTAFAVSACQDQPTSTYSDTESHVVTAEIHPANTHDLPGGPKDNAVTTAKSELDSEHKD